MAALLAQAEAGQSVVIPGYTHLQRAQPVLLAHHLLAYFFVLERDWRRFADWAESSWMPLGAGALAGVNYPLDREQVAAELGFDRVAPNAMDAVAARDAAFAYLAIVANCALTLSRLAEEIVLWTHARSSAWPRFPNRGLRARASCLRSAIPTGPSWCGQRRPASWPGCRDWAQC